MCCVRVYLVTARRAEEHIKCLPLVVVCHCWGHTLKPFCYGTKAEFSSRELPVFHALKMYTNVVTDELKMNKNDPRKHLCIHTAATTSTQPLRCHTRSLSNISNWVGLAAI